MTTLHWEPLLLAYGEDDKPTSWNIECSLDTHASEWLKGTSFGVHSDSGSGNTVVAGQQGGPSSCMLDDNLATFWDAQVRDGHAWVIFDLKR